MPSAGLKCWLDRATRGLAPESASKVRDEIGQHCELAREDGIAAGLPPAEADRSAISVLGNSWAANIRHRRVLLTKLEAALLTRTKKEGPFGWLRSEASWLGLLLIWMPATISERPMAALGLAVWFLFVLFLVVWAPPHPNLFRCLRWILQGGILALTSGHGVVHSCVVLILGFRYVWVESKRAAIRRKLPVEQWPRQLHL